MKNSRRTRPVWLSVLFGLSLAGVIGSMAWAIASYRGLEDRLAELPRAVVPGAVDIDVTEPETLTIFYEDPTGNGTFIVQSSGTSTLDALPVDLTVTGPSEETVPVSRYESDLRFDYDGRVATAIAVFDATTPGIYHVRATGDVPAMAQVSSGDVVDVALVANVVGVIGLFFISIVGVAVAVAVFVARRGAVSPTEEFDRRLAAV